MPKILLAIKDRKIHKGPQTGKSDRQTNYPVRTLTINYLREHRASWGSNQASREGGDLEGQLVSFMPSEHTVLTEVLVEFLLL